MSKIVQIQKFGKIFHDTQKTIQQIRKLTANNQSEQSHLELVSPLSINWAQKMMHIFNVNLTVTGHTGDTSPRLFVGNHISYLDIPLLMSVQHLVFVAKSEVASWPVFGNACKEVGTVFIKRENKLARRNVIEAVTHTIQERKLSVVIFPSGTTTLNENVAWRWGAFQIAKQNNIPLQPFRLRYQPLRDVAYIDDDVFPLHIWKLLGKRGIVAELEFHEPVMVNNPEEDSRYWQAWAQEFVKN